MTNRTKNLNKQYCVCSNHFEDSQLMNILTKNKLIHTAVPTLMNFPNPPPKLTPSRPLPKSQIVPTPSTSQIRCYTKKLQLSETPEKPEARHSKCWVCVPNILFMRDCVPLSTFLTEGSEALVVRLVFYITFLYCSHSLWLESFIFTDALSAIYFHRTFLLLYTELYCSSNRCIVKMLLW